MGTAAARRLWGAALGILPCLIGFSCARLEVYVEQASVVVVEGQSITIPVSYASVSTQKPYVTWYFERPPNKEVQILKYLGEVTSIEEPQFRGRLNFVYPMPSRNISILITKAQEMDSGRYKCYVDVSDDSSSGGSNVGLINVTVLVLPSTPKCQIHGTPYIGSNVTLSCQSSSGKPSPNYSWIRSAPSTQVFFAPAQDAVKGTLTLMNLTAQMSGIYVCTSKNLAGSSSCNITVHVTSYSKTAVIVGAVIGSIAGICCLVILVVGLIYCYRRRKMELQEEVENEIKEDSQAPRPTTWAKGNDMDFKNGTLSSVNTTRDHKAYNSKSPSDSASVITAAGSNVGFKPNERAQVTTPTPSMSSQSLPSYMAPANGSYYNNAAAPRDTVHRPNGHPPPVPRKEPAMVSGVTPSNLVRMGAVPVMVPAQSQAGSLV
ncbi:endothelial cell-selective adhesion molecule [Spea bombifrons]|uniref:endothelial cell-selective adhesion molecule n=1 Tax=Spea bombifrons TaxID=233779 RepID=UPI002348F6AB|nr:endothelial cell-selective adhesion molecule [Spea bombifrons]